MRLGWLWWFHNFINNIELYIESIEKYLYVIRVYQYFKCLIGSPLTAIFLRVLSIIYLIAYFLFNIARACSSWSIYISNSSINSLLTNSYSEIKANNLSISPFNCLFLSSPIKCYFLSLYYYAIKPSSYPYWALILAFTSFSLLFKSFPLATSLAKFAAWFPASPLFFYACCNKLL